MFSKYSASLNPGGRHKHKLHHISKVEKHKTNTKLSKLFGQEVTGAESSHLSPVKQVISTMTEPHNPGDNFPRFPEMAKELRDTVWQHASNEPRLIYIHLHVPSSAPPPAPFDRFIMNEAYLADAAQSRRSLLLACSESRDEVLRDEALRASGAGGAPGVNCLNMLRIAHLRPTRADLIYLGGLWSGGQSHPEDADTIIPLSLLLGDVMPQVMINADIFASFFNPQSGRQLGDPVETALADLRAGEGAPYAALLANNNNNNTAGLPQPRLPERMIFMLDNFRLRWYFAPPCADPGHRGALLFESCCIHYDHLEIIADEDMDHWMEANLSEPDDDNGLSRGQKNRRIQRETVPAIRAVWAGWRSQPDIAAQVPRLFFARIRPSQ